MQSQSTLHDLVKKCKLNPCLVDEILKRLEFTEDLNYGPNVEQTNLAVCSVLEMLTIKGAYRVMWQV